MKQTSLTRERAIALAETGWWKDVDAEAIVRFQLFEQKLCMDFGDFHGAVEKVLGRPVWSHEFASIDEPGGLKNEYLGEADPPTFNEIMDLIPEEKRVMVFMDGPVGDGGVGDPETGEG